MASFPRPPLPAFLEHDTDTGSGFDDLLPPVLKIARACKHGVLDCQACGTTERRDVLHTTQGGRGVVGRLRSGR